jgi:hypothetical protein
VVNFQAPAALHQGDKAPVPVGYEAGCATERVWTFRGEGEVMMIVIIVIIIKIMVIV